MTRLDRKPFVVERLNGFEFGDILLQVGNLYRHKTNSNVVCVITGITFLTRKLSRGTKTTEYSVTYRHLESPAYHDDIVTAISLFAERYVPLNEVEKERITNVDSSGSTSNSN